SQGSRKDTPENAHQRNAGKIGGFFSNLLARICFKRKRLKQRYARQINMLEHVPFAQTSPFERGMR
ncbi:hypothetical protein, partial [Mesorhizobium xinjiangense]|uniref:hypothetical protein n=1 Tax=Mesorhizobium xinjiangense TaxID=2678685 RepID=UPI001AEDE2D3